MPHPANFIITNARVFTADPANPHAEAVAVSGERITFVGTAADAENWRGPRTRIIDAGGRTLMPGFIDSHFHLFWGSLELGDIQLVGAKSLGDLAARVNEFVSRNPDQYSQDRKECPDLMR